MIRLIDDNKNSNKAINEFLKKIEKKKDLIFSTSGTTGFPKIVKHNLSTISKHVKHNCDKDVWGLTYDYSKIAASQVIIQAYQNNNMLVNLFGKSTNQIHSLIEKYKITHLSGTPTFYKLNFKNEVFKSLKQITLGGEVMSDNILVSLKKVFPNADVKNIYALTEYGSILASSSHIFKLSERTKKNVKIKNNTIHVYFDKKWKDTGDVVKRYDDDSFEIIGRESSMINVGGQKVNPFEIENYINDFPNIISCKIYGVKNSLTGNIIGLDILSNKKIDIKLLKKMLRNNFKNYEIPRVINFVNNLKTNSTGKILRK